MEDLEGAIRESNEHWEERYKAFEENDRKLARRAKVLAYTIIFSLMTIYGASCYQGIQNYKASSNVPTENSNHLKLEYNTYSVDK